MKLILRTYLGFLDLCANVVGLGVAAIALLVSVEVLIRTLGIGTLHWLIEVVEYALFMMTFIAAPWVLSKGAHVRVDVLLVIASPRMRFYLELLIDSLGMVISFLLFYYGLDATIDSLSKNALIYKQLVVPEGWLLIALPFSGALLTIEFARRVWRTFTEAAVEDVQSHEGF